jgi:hypothetical protein
MAHKARALFNVALGEFLFFAERAKAVANNHGRDYSIWLDLKQVARSFSPR